MQLQTGKCLFSHMLISLFAAYTGEMSVSGEGKVVFLAIGLSGGVSLQGVEFIIAIIKVKLERHFGVVRWIINTL